MQLRIKEICKEKGVTMTKIAERLNINPVTLSQSLNGNPTLSRLKEVADILEVEVSELFVRTNRENDVYGCLYVSGKPFVVNNKQEIIDLLKDI